MTSTHHIWTKCRGGQEMECQKWAGHRNQQEMLSSQQKDCRFTNTKHVANKHVAERTTDICFEPDWAANQYHPNHFTSQGMFKNSHWLTWNMPCRKMSHLSTDVDWHPGSTAGTSGSGSQPGVSNWCRSARSPWDFEWNSLLYLLTFIDINSASYIFWLWIWSECFVETRPVNIWLAKVP